MRAIEENVGTTRRKINRKSDIPLTSSTPKCSIKEWSNWSLTSHTEDEIREKCLTDFNNVCFTFVCEASKMSTEFIEELMTLSTGVLNKDNYDELYEKVHKTVLYNAGITKEKVPTWEVSISNVKGAKGNNSPYYSEKTVASSQMIDRIDWSAISRYQKLDEAFMRKFQSVLNWKYIKHSQKMSIEFINEFADKLQIKTESTEGNEKHRGNKNAFKKI